MEVGQEVRMLEDRFGLNKGDRLTCYKAEDNGTHLFSNKIGSDFYLKPHRYELINETMQVGQKVRMLLDDYVFRKGEIVTCCRVENDDCHEFKNEKGQKYYLNPEDYELITVSDSAVDFVDEELQLIENWSSDLKAEYLKIALLTTKEHYLKMEAMMQEQIDFLTKRIQDISK